MSGSDTPRSTGENAALQHGVGAPGARRSPERALVAPIVTPREGCWPASLERPGNAAFLGGGTIVGGKVLCLVRCGTTALASMTAW